VEKPDERLKRSRVFYGVLFLFLGTLFLLLFIALQSLILPILIGMISAYIAMPLLNLLRKRGVPKAVGVLILFGGFIFVVFVIGEQVVSLMPDEREKIELRINVQHKLNESYLGFLGKSSFDDEGNVVSTLFEDELHPVIENINAFLHLDAQEDSLYQSYVDKGKISTVTKGYYLQAQTLPKALANEKPEAIEEDVDRGNLIGNLGFQPENSRIAGLLSAISNWLVTPFIFLFLLFDDGQIKRFLIDLVPNRYFEMTLTTFDNVDAAIGQYLRGTLMECTLVGVSFLIGLLIIGFDIQAALFIGIVAGIANAIPFLGPAIGLIVGVTYAMVVESIDPIIPFVSGDAAILMVVILVGIVQLLDNAIYNPVVLGKAVNLHPLIVIVGVAGGSILFGFAGMLFAVPTIVVVNEIVSTLHRQLKDYFIIY
jgi:predicted PurR-regulated permease PerM